MLNHNHTQNSRGVNFHSDSSNSAFTVHLTDPSREPQQKAPSAITTDKKFLFLGDKTLKIAQLNCFNRQAVVENLLAEDSFDILLLQEPWVNPHTLRLPAHMAWHDIMAYDYNAKTFFEKTHTGIYISKKIRSWNITMLPSGSPLITAVEIKNIEEGIPLLRILSVYNPPTHNTGLPALESWLKAHSSRRIPTIIGMDANLHHTLWNPVTYHHTHTLAKNLIKIQGQAGFKLHSQRNIPTFYPRARGKISPVIYHTLKILTQL